MPAANLRSASSGRKVRLARSVARATFCIGGQFSARNARRQQPWNVGCQRAVQLKMIVKI